MVPAPPEKLQCRSEAVFQSKSSNEPRMLHRAAGFVSPTPEATQPGEEVSLEACRFTLPSHEFRAERALRFELIVRSAPEAHSIHRRAATSRHRVDVVEFEGSPCVASHAARAREGAPASVALPHGAPNPRGNVAVGACCPYALRSGANLSLFERGDEGVQRSVDHLGDIAGGDRVAQKFLSATEFVARSCLDD